MAIAGSGEEESRIVAARTPLVSGNWKMNTDLASAVELADDVVAGCSPFVERCEVVVFPPFPYLQAVGKTLGHHGVLLGAQDVYCRPNGAFTGEVSAAMLLDLNVAAVLVGHSERRHVIDESDELVNAKAKTALEEGLAVTLCIGETMEQRQSGRTKSVNVGQLMSGLRGVPAGQAGRLTIAYEPVWAIGTGTTATPEDAQSVHKVIRATLADLYDDGVAGSVRIQYGGSVSGENAEALFAQPDVDGFLVGGASLKSHAFTEIVRIAAGGR
ncbi:MAG: triose-phosphate isomerase [Planctomycetota bacterium]|jgi:triosephosphate isomerase